MSPLSDRDERAAAYVLGTLTAAQRKEVEQALPGDGALRAAVEEWEARLLPLTALPEPVVPSAVLWERIDRSIAPAAAAAPDKASRARWWDRIGLWRGLAAGGFAAAAIMAVVVGVRMQVPERADYVVVLAAPQDMRPGWVLRMTDASTLQLEPLATTTVPDQRVLQLWTKADGWKGPVSLGLVAPGRTVQVRLDKLPPVQPNQLFEITLEPAGGSPLGRPTGPILYIGRAVKLG